MKLGKVILRPLITEKSTRQAGESKFTFAVDLKASKSAVAQAVGDTYKVEVVDVSINILPGKEKRTISQKHYARRPRVKKAIVTLKKGQTISLFDLGEKK